MGFESKLNLRDERIPEKRLALLAAIERGFLNQEWVDKILNMVMWEVGS